MPELIRLPCGDGTAGWLKNVSRLGPRRIVLHPANRCRTEVEARAGENLGGFHFPEDGTQDFQALHDVVHEVREFVHRLGQTDERIRTFLIESAHPRGDGERTYQEVSGGLGERPAADGAKLKDCQSRSWRVVGSSMGLKLLHPGILDADLLAKEMDFLLQPVPFGPPSELTVQTLRGPTLGQRQGGSGERDDLDYCRADATGPASGQWERTELRGMGHDQPPEGIQG
jgi:hypothetical protein